MEINRKWKDKLSKWKLNHDEKKSPISIKFKMVF